LLATLAVGCGPGRIPPPATPAPTLRGPTDAIPAELDVALRIDLGRIRSVLGQEAFERLRQSSTSSGAHGDAETERLMTDALSRSDAVWIAFRPAERADITDSVTVLRGKFAGFDPRDYDSSPRWQGPQDLGGGWRRYDRQRPKVRAAAARIYARSEDVLVVVSTAPLDSVERRLEGGADDAHMEPVEEGILSLDARADAVGRWLLERTPTGARLLAGVRRLRLRADLHTVGLEAELELEMKEESTAKDTAEALAQVAKALAESGGLEARVIAGLKVEVVGGRVVLRLSLPPDVLAAVLGCVGGGSCG